ncbi:MAG: hypothetical protein M1550_05140 [Deltaproteobacteria bacterium]|nr:hypothetical protein [Deltaproteobacteria bacterium]
MVALRHPALLRWAALAFGLAQLAWGCASPTPYQKRDKGEGYLDYETQPGVHYVSFIGNARTGKGTVERYWNRRAAEICGGPDRYEVLGLDTVGEAVMEPSPNVLWPATRPRIEGLIRCKPK